MRFKHHNPSAICLHYIPEKADISQIWQLAPKQARWIKNTKYVFWTLR